MHVSVMIGLPKQQGDKCRLNIRSNPEIMVGGGGGGSTCCKSHREPHMVRTELEMKKPKKASVPGSLLFGRHVGFKLKGTTWGQRCRFILGVEWCA
jgi:hypothetical protein